VVVSIAISSELSWPELGILAVIGAVAMVVTLKLFQPPG
jgi:hypothetical protein